MGAVPLSCWRHWPLHRPRCFETDGDVPEAMRATLGAIANAYITVKGPKFHVDLAG